MLIMKLKEKGKSAVKWLKGSKSKHICGFIVFLMVFSTITSNFTPQKHNSMADSTIGMQADLYHSNNSSIGGFIYDAVDSIGSGTESLNIAGGSSASYEPQWDNASKSEVVMEEDYLTTDTSVKSKSAKLVYSANLDIETKDIDAALDSIYAKIKEVDGIIESEELNNMGNVTYDDYVRYYDNARAFIYVRVPQEHYETFINSIETEDGSIVVTDVAKSVENLTDTYYDLDSRLRSLRVQEERLFDFMKSAKSVSEMLDVEDRLSEVQYEIDRITNSLETIDNDVKYSKVKLDVREVVKYTERTENPKNFIERLWGYITGSVENFLDNVEGLLELVIYSVPNLVLLVLIYIGCVKVIRWFKAKRKNKADKNTKNIE